MSQATATDMPTEFRIFESEFKHGDQSFRFDEMSAAEAIAQAKDRPVLICYDHALLSPPALDPSMDTPVVAAELTLAVRQSASGSHELWATDIYWTERAREMLGNLPQGCNPVFYPAFEYNQETGRIGRLLGIDMRIEATPAMPAPRRRRLQVKENEPVNFDR